MMIEVTAEDIEQGERGNCGKCPIARAMDRAGVKHVYVGEWSMDGMVGREFWSMTHIDSTRAFIRAFDEGDPVEPFSFSFQNQD